VVWEVLSWEEEGGSADLGNVFRIVAHSAKLLFGLVAFPGAVHPFEEITHCP
jgi:hypothetical protein